MTPDMGERRCDRLSVVVALPHRLLTPAHLGGQWGGGHGVVLAGLHDPRPGLFVGCRVGLLVMVSVSSTAGSPGRAYQRLATSFLELVGWISRRQQTDRKKEDGMRSSWSAEPHVSPAKLQRRHHTVARATPGGRPKTRRRSGCGD